MLRAVAAIAILLFHCRHVCDYLPEPISVYLKNILSIGWVGVDIFFVISGYIVTKIYAESDITTAQFLAKRMGRIYIGWWVVFGIFIIAMLITGQSLDKYNLLKSLLLVPQKIREAPIGLVWTLHYEMAFYVLFSILIYSRWKNAVILIMGAAILYLYSFEPNAPKALGYLRYALSPYLFEFIAGYIIYTYFSKERFSVAIPTALLVVAAIVSYVFYGRTILSGAYQLHKVALFVIPCALLVMWAVSDNQKPRSVSGIAMVKIGDASYMLYLIHGALLVVLSGITHHYAAITLIASIPTALLLHRFAEKPLLILSRNYFASSLASKAANL